MNELNVMGLTLSGWLVIPLIYLGWIFSALIVKRILLLTCLRFARKTQTKFDDILIHAVDFPLNILILTLGGVIVERIIPFFARDHHAPAIFPVIFKAAIIVAFVLFIDRFLVGLIRQYALKIDILKTSSGVTRAFVHFTIFGIGILVLLDSFGVSITPVIASLGIGSLAVALAIQPTLENLFSGIQLVVDKPIQEGQFIRLDSGEEGYVDKIGWRSTWIRLPQNNIIIISNKVLVNSKILNYYYPDTDVIITVPVGVHYNSDLDHVEQVTIEIAQEVLNTVEGGVKDFSPIVLYKDFDSSSINFLVILRIKEYNQQGLIRHEFIKRLHKRFSKEGIVIPYPIQAVNYDQEKAFLHTRQLD